MSILERSDTSGLDSQTLKNYQAVIRYYEMKQSNFKSWWNQRMLVEKQKIKKDLEFSALKNINEEWTKINQKLDKIFETTGNVVTKINKPEDVNIKFSPDSLDSQLYNKYRQAFLKKEQLKIEQPEKKISGLNIKSSLGTDYENFIKQNLTNMIIKNQNDIMAEITDKKYVTTGKGIRAKGAAIISDIVLYDSNEIQSYDIASGLEVEYNSELLDAIGVEQYIDSGMYEKAAHVYGIAAKNWFQGKERGEFTSSKRIVLELNKKYSNSITKENDNPKSWNQEYATSTANLHVSSRLVDLLGPANILVMLGDSYIWMTNYISNRFFYINILYKSKKENNEILDITASPSGSIHIRKQGMLNWVGQENSKILQGLIKPIDNNSQIYVKVKNTIQ